MLKQVLTGAAVVTLMLVGHLPAQAQSQQPASKPQAQPQQQAVPQGQVSPQELQKFANAIKQLLLIEREANEQMVQAIQQEGLNPNRFNEIYRGQQNTQAQPPTSVSQEEKQKFTRAMTKVQAIEKQVQPKMKKAVQDQGLDLQRFEQIMATVQQNSDLQQQVKKLIQG